MILMFVVQYKFKQKNC